MWPKLTTLTSRQRGVWMQACEKKLGHDAGMHASRLLSILLRLQTQGRQSARALAEAYEVSVRTIYRDVDQLSAAGVPVFSTQGRQGGFELRGDYRTRLTGLDRPEAESLFLAGAPFAAEQLGLGAALERTRMKLLASLPEATQADAQRVASRFHLDPVAWFQGPDEQRLLPTLAAAVWTQRIVRIHYERWQGVVDRRVAPLGLVLKGGLWYLVAAVDAQPRTYRVASILSLAIEETPAHAVPRFDLARYWKRFAADYEARMQAGSATVRARPAALRELARMSHAMAQAVATAGAADRSGWHRLTIPIESIDVAVGELLRLGPDVQALGPPALRRAVKQALKSLSAAYDNSKD
jgi:predicted DNA-binding transcriptional regulator YafY